MPRRPWITLLLGGAAILIQACSPPISQGAAIEAEASCAAAGGELMTTSHDTRPRCAQLPSDDEIFPPEVNAFVVHHGPWEPRLWPADAMQGFSQRLRILDVALGIPQALFIRIDTDTSGRSLGHVLKLKTEDGSNWTVSEQREFSVGAESMIRLNGLVQTADLHNVHDFGKENEACFDGHHAIIEQATPEAGYGFAVGNLWCVKNANAEAILAEMQALAAMK